MMLQQIIVRHSAVVTALGATAILALFSGCGSTGERPEESPVVETSAETASPSSVEMAVETQQRLGVECSAVELRKLDRSVSLSGVVKPDATKVAEVRSLTRGRMTSVESTIGDRVTRNQVLAQYDNIELGDLISQRAAAVAALKRAEIESRVAREAVHRARALVEVGALAEAERQRREAELDRANTQIAEAQTSVEQINRKLRRLGFNDDRADGTVDGVDSERTLVTRITAPIGGVVTEAEAVAGEVIESTDILFRIADLSDVWVQGNLQEKDIGLVQTGMPVTVSVIAFPEQKFDGRVTYLGDLVDPDSRTLPVRCVVGNPGWQLKLDMFATISISLRGERPVVAVPASAIQEIDGRTVVFVQRSPSRFEVQEVDLGASGSGWVEISRGLSPGEDVASAGSFQLKSVLLRDSMAEED